MLAASAESGIPFPGKRHTTRMRVDHLRSVLLHTLISMIDDSISNLTDSRVALAAQNIRQVTLIVLELIQTLQQSLYHQAALSNLQRVRGSIAQVPQKTMCSMK